MLAARERCDLVDVEVIECAQGEHRVLLFGEVFDQGLVDDVATGLNKICRFWICRFSNTDKTAGAFIFEHLIERDVGNETFVNVVPPASCGLLGLLADVLDSSAARDGTRQVKGSM